ncbi:MAG: DUF3995 domain-containing protein, partial [Chitinophagaceae bacterium]
MKAVLLTDSLLIGLHIVNFRFFKMKNIAFNRRVLIIPVTINTAIFIFLSILHFYWAFGGKLWYDDVLPTNSKGLNRMNPSSTAGLIVAFGLLFFALVTIGSHGVFDKYFKRKYFHYSMLAIAVIFFLRAIGDFRFI